MYSLELTHPLVLGARTRADKQPCIVAQDGYVVVNGRVESREETCAATVTIDLADAAASDPGATRVAVAIAAACDARRRE